MSKGKQQQLLRDYIEKLGRQNIALDGNVTAVNESDYTCTVKLANGLELPDILLNSSRDATRGVIQIPAIGSYVRMLCVGEPDWLVISVEIIQKIVVLVDESIQIAAPEIIFNDGKNGGIPISKNIADRLNTVENDLNTLKDIISAWSVTLNDGGGALKTGLAGIAAPGSPPLPGSWAATRIDTTSATDMENKAIKH